MIEIITASLGNFLPAIIAITGTGVGMFTVIPMLVKVIKMYKEALEELTHFTRKYKQFFTSEDVRKDFSLVVETWDDATEYTAKICRRLRMTKTATFFQDIIKHNWYR